MDLRSADHFIHHIPEFEKPFLTDYPFGSHYSPERKSLTRPGSVFEQYLVCRPVKTYPVRPRNISGSCRGDRNADALVRSSFNFNAVPLGVSFFRE